MVLTYFIILLTIHVIVYKTSNSRSSCTSLCKYDYITFNAHTHRCSCVQKWKVKQQSWAQGWGVKVWRVLTLSLFQGKMLIYRWKIIKNLGDHTLRFLSIQEISAAPPPPFLLTVHVHHVHVHKCIMGRNPCTHSDISFVFHCLLLWPYHGDV